MSRCRGYKGGGIGHSEPRCGRGMLAIVCIMNRQALMMMTTSTPDVVDDMMSTMPPHCACCRGQDNDEDNPRQAHGKVRPGTKKQP
jgi:hypothetical protein